MDLSIILTYRCDSRCSMCYIWKNPTHPDYEIDIAVLKKLPAGFDHVNLTGGEPTLRKDLKQICNELYPRARKLEISTNGLHVDILEPIVREYPDVKIRISIEGIDRTNDLIRGEKNGYKKKVEAMERLLSAGGQDLGFATTFQDENLSEILEVYNLSKTLKVELATSALHNAFQFHKNDNHIYDRIRLAREVEKIVSAMMKSKHVKDWFRAYLNLGLIAKILGHDRLHPCTQGTDNVFIDPWSDVYACNVRNDLLMGNLRNQSWEEVYHGAQANLIRSKVAACAQNCWMVSSAKTAMRNKYFPRLPRLAVLSWVLHNKARSILGLPIRFEQYINYGDVVSGSSVPRRMSYLEKQEKRVLQPPVSKKYSQLDGYFNR